MRPPCTDTIRLLSQFEEGEMPSKSPQKPSAKKAGKTLKEKREAKREKKEKRPPLG